jgi:cysteine synthase A
MKYKNILEVIGNTPLVRITVDDKLRAEIYAKIEAFNPSGSIKDRMAFYMLTQAKKTGTLKPGMTIVEATTGNTGIAFAMLAAIKGYHMIAVMPENMSMERRKLMEAYGAKIILTSREGGPKEAIRKRNKIAGARKDVWIPGQFENGDNSDSHELTTGAEIVKDTSGRVDAFVAGVGTGGTLMGVAKTLKKNNPNVRIIAVEPFESGVLSGGAEGNHGIQGIGEGFIPKIVERKFIDSIEKVSTEEAIVMTKRLAREEGIFVGFSSGANLVASLRIARELGRKKTVVTVFPDRGERYLSEI